jgi:hypothetical protein
MSIGSILAAALTSAFGSGFEKQHKQLANAVEEAVKPTFLTLQQRLERLEAASNSGSIEIPKLPPDSGSFQPPVNTPPSGSIPSHPLPPSAPPVNTPPSGSIPSHPLPTGGSSGGGGGGDGGGSGGGAGRLAAE